MNRKANQIKKGSKEVRMVQSKQIDHTDDHDNNTVTTVADVEGSNNDITSSFESNTSRS
jgi:hypothetical protein